MRREYIEDAVLILGGGALIAGAWIVYWPAGLMVAGLVMILLGVLAYKHHGQHEAQRAASMERSERDKASMPAAAWRFHGRSSHSNGRPSTFPRQGQPH